ncbi:hypothetical protein B0H12DRAFT_1098060 [Mycena haematopus]|nr:hypothetical protein B0H12DRAFT_1098060 [Mycena haematopus]
MSYQNCREQMTRHRRSCIGAKCPPTCIGASCVRVSCLAAGCSQEPIGQGDTEWAPWYTAARWVIQRPNTTVAVGVRMLCCCDATCSRRRVRSRSGHALAHGKQPASRIGIGRMEST